MRSPHLVLVGSFVLTVLDPGNTAAQTAPAQPQAGTGAGATPAADPGGSATTEELSKLRKEVQELKDQLEQLQSDRATSADVLGVQSDLENFKYQMQRERETKSALSNRNLLITGMVQTRFAWTSESISTPVAKNIANTSVNNPQLLHGRHTSFDTPNAIVTFSGLLYRDYEKARNLSYKLSIAAAAATSNFAAGANNNNAFLNVLDANVTYQVLPTIENDGDRLSFTLGQQLLPFGLEANTTEELRPVINYAQFVAPTGFNQRQLGIVANGEFFSQYDFGYNYRQSILNVAAGVVNGNGPNRDDDNDRKDVVGRIAITVPATYDSWLRELRIGASGYYGRVTLVDETGAYVANGERNRIGVDLYYNHWPFGFTYELALLSDDVVTSGQKVRRNGQAHTATAFYSFGQQFLRSVRGQAKYDDWWPKTFQPFLRYDRWDPNQDLSNSHVEILTAGLNFFFAETTKLQLNGNHRIHHAGSGPTKESQELLAQLQFGF